MSSVAGSSRARAAQKRPSRSANGSQGRTASGTSAAAMLTAKRNELPGQRQLHLLGDGHPGLVLGLPGAGPQVGRDHHLLQFEQRRGGDRLVLEHVQGGAGHDPVR